MLAPKSEEHTADYADMDDDIDTGYDNNGGEPMSQTDNMGNPPFDQNSTGGNEDYDADFDAGVEANEEEDPKKFIQQLTGKLSQSLKKYNDGLPKPDAELDKYVAGMILKQSIAGLGQEDRKDILAKIDDIEEPEDADLKGQPDSEEQPEPNGNPESEEMPQQEDSMQNECLRNDMSKDLSAKGGKKRKGYRVSPFVGKK